MANDLDNEDGGDGASVSPPDLKAGRTKPTKSLPTDRISMEKQWVTMRGLVKASLAADRGGVSNSEVARYAGVVPNSVSNCNGFWVDAGLVVREGNKIKPVDAMFDYDQAAEWTPDTAATKLAGVLGASWFGKAMLTKLAIKPTTINDALAFLAQECRASPEYKDQLLMVLEYLRAAGLIVIDGTTVSKAPNRIDAPPPPPPLDPRGQSADERKQPPPGVGAGTKRITIALPDKESVSIELPQGFDADDWILVADQLAGYIKRWKRFQPTAALKAATEDADPNTPAGGSK